MIAPWLLVKEIYENDLEMRVISYLQSILQKLSELHNNNRRWFFSREL